MFWIYVSTFAVSFIFGMLPNRFWGAAVGVAIPWLRWVRILYSPVVFVCMWNITASMGMISLRIAWAFFRAFHQRTRPQPLVVVFQTKPLPPKCVCGHGHHQHRHGPLPAASPCRRCACPAYINGN